MAVAMNLSEKVMKHVIMYCLVHKVDLADSQMKETVRESINRTGSNDSDNWPGVVRNVIEGIIKAENQQNRPEEQIIPAAPLNQVSGQQEEVVEPASEFLKSDIVIDDALVDQMFQELEQEAALKEKLAAQSKLAYADGQPVKLMDVFVDEEDKRRFEAGEQTFGYHMLVHRINEDETIDVCIGCNIALKMNNVAFDPNNSTLLYRDGVVRSPLDEIFKGLL